MSLRVRYLGECEALQVDNLILLADSLEESGALTTEELFANGMASLAHYYPGRGIKRYQREIGTQADLEVLGEVDVPDPSFELFFGGLMSDPNWDREPV